MPRTRSCSSDSSLVGLLWPLLETFETVRHVVIMRDGAGEVPDAAPRGIELHDYEELLAAASPVEFDVEDEHRAASMCYTSGTTGNPKGVVYSHRSTFLHTMGVLTADSLGASERDTILPVVPMFHANAWGLAHAAVACGAKLVMPGPDLSAPTLAGLIESERVTVAAGVPTIWMGVLPELKGRDTSHIRVIPCGGSAVPKSLSEGFREVIGKPILQAWGMTETSPIAAVCHLKTTFDGLSDDEKADLRATVGLISVGVDFRVVGPDGEAPWDGETSGELQVAGNWIAREYYNDARSPESFTADGWLRTGDVAVVEPSGYIRLVDRTKDVVKSGGEWISSVELENEIMGHPKVAEAAVDRPAAPEVVRAPARLRRGEARRGAHPRGGPRAPRREDRQVVDARRRGVHRRGAEDQRGEVLEEGPPRPLRRSRAADPAGPGCMR